jgi:hypothetical protein
VLVICNLFIDENCNEGGRNYGHTSARSRTKQYKRRLPKRPWFNKECHLRRKVFFKAKNKFNSNDTVENKDSLKVASKTYKTEIKKQYKLYHKKLHQKIRNLKSSNPKEYWAIINNAEGGGYGSAIDKISLEVFAEHFKKLNEGIKDNIDTIGDVPSSKTIEYNSAINAPFTAKEILHVIKKLKNNKACGVDRVLNEHIKCSADLFLPLYVNLFNLILNTGKVPTNWTIGIIKPLYKNKGSKVDPDNYRGITLLSCLGKLFTGTINYRLEQFLNDAGTIGPEQAGFRKGHSTIDHVFVLHNLINIYLQKGKRLYGCFVDYRKAFDSVDRVELWQKLLKSDINGRIFNVVVNLYEQAKSCLAVNGCVSDYFPCSIGVRQGENLSPLLFAIFLNDLEMFLSRAYNGAAYGSRTISEALETEDTVTYFKLFILLYADDTILLADSPEELQKALDSMYQYCITYKLEVNKSKTKIVVFSRGKIRKVPLFKYGGDVLEVVEDYTYLGIIFNFNGNFNKAVTKLCEQASRAMYSILNKAGKLCLPIDIKIQLFQSVVMPILLYGVEVWGFQHLDKVEKVYLKFLKMLLKVNKSTASNMVYGELGVYPLQVYARSRIVNYWGRLLTGPQDKLSVVLYKVILELYQTGNVTFKWLNNVKTILDNSGLSNIWDTQTFPSLAWLKNHMKQISKDQFVQDWHSQIFDSGKCLNYRVFKTEFKCEPYILSLPDNFRHTLTKFRCRNHKLPIEIDAYIGIDRTKRICKLCNSADIGDEYHYLLVCDFFTEHRRVFLKQYYNSKPSTQKLHQLLNSGTKVLVNVCKFIKIITDKVAVK